MRSVSGLLVRTYLVQDGRDDLLEDHVLICGGREDFVELVCLVAHGAWSHGQLDLGAFHAIRLDDNTTVFAHFAVVPPPASDDNIDVCFLASVDGQTHLGLRDALRCALS